MSELGLNILLLVMLGTTAAWCWIVHRRLGRVAIGQKELAEFVGSLSEATRRAEIAARELRDVGREVAVVTRDQEDTAKRESEELGRLLASGSRVAQRLEHSVAEGVRALASARTITEIEDAEERRPARRTRSPRAPRAQAATGRQAKAAAGATL